MNHHQQLYKQCSRQCRASNNSLAKICHSHAAALTQSAQMHPGNNGNGARMLLSSTRRFHGSIATFTSCSTNFRTSTIHNTPTATTANNRITNLVEPTKRYFSQEATAAAATKDANDSSSSSSDYKFQHPKAEQLFHKMTSLQLEQINAISLLINEKLDITITEADERYGMDAGGSAAGGGDASTQGAEKEPKEEKTHFDLKLVSFDAKAKIKVIKEVRALSGLGLKEAKDMVEGAPKVVKKDLKLEEAEELKKKLEELGAVIELE